MENKGIWGQMDNPNRTIIKSVTDEEMLKFWKDLEDGLNNTQEKIITLSTGASGFKLYKDGK